MARSRLAFDPIAEARRQWEAHGWTDAAPGMAVVTSVMRMQQVFLKAVDDVLAPFSLSFARYEVLVLLWFSRQGQLPLGKMSSRLQVHAASVTNAVQRLEQDGLVERRPHPSDGRTVLARLTDKGEALVKEATQAVNEQVFANLELSADEMAELFRLLRKLRVASGDFGEPDLAPAQVT